MTFIHMRVIKKQVVLVMDAMVMGAKYADFTDDKDGDGRQAIGGDYIDKIHSHHIDIMTFVF